MRRILFVDDQRTTLNDHRDVMQKYSTEVDARFALGAVAALEILRSEPIDVVVTDMHMPDIDGATLLGAIKEERPDVVRIMLCPLAEIDSVLVALPVCHQILAKPLDADTLFNAIERIHGLRGLLTDSLRKKIGGLQQLPSLPSVYFEMMNAMARENVTSAKIASIIEKDAAMAAKTLQLVNSACFSLLRRINSIDQAVTYLGMDTVRDLWLTVHVFTAFGNAARRSGFSFDAEQEHSLLTAKVVRLLFANPQHARNASTAALLHDIGKLVLAVCNTETYKKVVQVQKSSGRPQHEIEAELFGVTHAEVGAYLLGLWGLPHPILEAVAYHHNPGAALERTFDIPTAVSVADALVEELTQNKPFPITQHLEALNLSDKLPEWRAIVQEQLELLKPALPTGTGK